RHTRFSRDWSSDVCSSDLVKKGIFRPIPSDAARANAVLSGEIDLVPSIAPSLMDMVGGNPDVRVAIAPGYRVTFLEMNPDLAPRSEERRVGKGWSAAGRAD